MSNRIVELFVKMREHSIEVKKDYELQRRFPGLCKARIMSISELKELWDSYDGIATKDLEIDGETVHFVLNEKGCGSYCAV